jgi:hypothetical protein
LDERYLCQAVGRSPDGWAIQDELA